MEVMQMEIWKDTLLQLLQHLKVANADAMIEEYRAAYSQPHRKYHNLEHINHLLTALKAVPQPSAALLTAAMYHFFVYDPLKEDNEEKSAEYLRNKLKAAGVSQQFIDSVTAIMLAPANSADLAFASKDAQYLSDIDMSIFGDSPHVYQRYAELVRDEYSSLSDFNWYHQRVRFLLYLLKSVQIFHTDEFKQLEKHARSNIANEVLSIVDSYERTLLAAPQRA